MAGFYKPKWIPSDQFALEQRKNAFRKYLQSAQGADLAEDSSEILSAGLLKLAQNRQGRHNTEIAYLSDVRHYVAAAMRASEDPLDPSPEFWIAYFTDYAQGRKTTTLYRHAYGVGSLFFRTNLASPTRTYTHERLLQQLARAKSCDIQRARPLYGDDVVALIRSYDQDHPRDLRNVAIVTIGSTRGLRGATIVHLLIEDSTFDERGLVLGLRNEKTARNSEIIYTGTPHTRTHEFCMPCTLRLLKDHLHEAGINRGPFFRYLDRWGHYSTAPLMPKSVTKILRKGLRRAGISEPDSYSSHSFRHGVAVSAWLKGWTLEDIMLVTMHRTRAGLEPYLSSLDPWHRTPALTVLDGTLPAQPVADQGWHHDEFA